MKRLIFLTCDQMEHFVGDDHLVAPHLQDFEILNVDWRKFKSETKVLLSDTNAERPAVLIRTTWNYHLYPKEFLDLLFEIKSAGLLLANPPELVKWNLNKIYLKELNEKGIQIPESHFFKMESQTQLTRHIEASALHTDWIVKPQVSLSAHNTFWIRSKTIGENIKSAVNALQGVDVVLQPFCTEVLDPGEISLVFFENDFSHAVLKTPKPGDFRVQEEHGGNIRHYLPTDAEISTARNVLKQVPHPFAYARVDMVPSSKGPLLMELELIEPSLYLRTHPSAPVNFAHALRKWSAQTL